MTPSITKPSTVLPTRLAATAERSEPGAVAARRLSEPDSDSVAPHDGQNRPDSETEIEQLVHSRSVTGVEIDRSKMGPNGMVTGCLELDRAGTSVSRPATGIPFDAVYPWFI